MNFIVKSTEAMHVSVDVQPADPYTNLHKLEITTGVYDEYTKKHLDPRSQRYFLSTAELARFADKLRTFADNEFAKEDAQTTL